MRRLLALALVAAGCTAAPEEPPAADQEMMVVLAVAYDPAPLRVGQRAVYRLVRQGDPAPRYAQLQVVASGEGDTLWVETKLPVEPQAMVVKTRLDRTGRIHEQWVGEPGSRGPARTWPRADGKPPEAPKPPGDARADVKVTDETVTVAGRAYLCKKVTTTLRYGGERASTMVNWCHPEVPFSFKLGDESLGGVVRRVYGRYTMELVDAQQTGARAELDVPRR